MCFWTSLVLTNTWAEKGPLGSEMVTTIPCWGLSERDEARFTFDLRNILEYLIGTNNHLGISKEDLQCQQARRQWSISFLADEAQHRLIEPGQGKERWEEGNPCLISYYLILLLIAFNDLSTSLRSFSISRLLLIDFSISFPLLTESMMLPRVVLILDCSSIKSFSSLVFLFLRL